MITFDVYPTKRIVNLNQSIIKRLTYIVYLLALTTFLGCDSDIFHSKLSEGSVEYKVTYPLMDDHDVMADFMPDKMTMIFKDNIFKTELSAGMGMFTTHFISDCENRNMKHLVKLVNKKYVTEYDTESISVLNDVYEDFTIVNTDDTKVIAGYNCKKLWIIFTDVSMPSFELYYTDEIKIKDANWSVPYMDVDGVMLEYLMKRNGVVMHLTATQIEKTEVDEDEFETPEKYEAISTKEMEQELNSLFETFNY